MEFGLNIYYLLGYVSAGYVMEALELKMSWMHDVYRTRHLKVYLGIALCPHTANHLMSSR
jgi:hypothetical protein